MDRKGVGDRAAVVIFILGLVIGAAISRPSIREDIIGGLGSLENQSEPESTSRGIVENLPKYPGSGEWTDPPAYLLPSSENIELLMKYTLKGSSVENVYNWYENQISDLEVERDYGLLNFGENELASVYYREEDRAVGIVVVGGPDYPGTCYLLGAGPRTAFSLEPINENRLMSANTKLLAW